MSLKTILEHIKEAIGSIFHHLPAELKGIIIPAAIKITDVVKTIFDIDSEDIIGHIIEKVGVEWEDKLRTHIPEVLIALRLYEAADDTTDYLVVLKTIVADLQPSTNNQWDTFWLGFSANLMHCLADGKLSLQECFHLALFYKDNHPS